MPKENKPEPIDIRFTSRDAHKAWDGLVEVSKAFDLFADFFAGLQKEKNWPQRSFGEECSLFHSEISEALEEYRNGRRLDEVYFNAENAAKPEGIPIELADTIIRILAFCAANRINIGDAIMVKWGYNLTRPERHGGKVI